MKKYCLYMFLPCLLLLCSCSSTDWNKVLQDVSQIALTEQDVAGGLKDALIQGISTGAEIASREDGYFGNELIRIALPPEVRRVESTLRNVGLEKEMDRVLLAINRGAENAASEAKPIFIGAIRQLTFEDVWNILRGEPDAATQFLRRTTSEQLTALFMPKVRESLGKVGATRYYGELVTAYNALPGTREAIDPDLGAYVTDKAIDGLFTLIAREEKNIRENPRARGTALMRRVFAAQD